MLAVAGLCGSAAVTLSGTPRSNDPVAMETSYMARELVANGIVPSVESIKDKPGAEALVKAANEGQTLLARALLRTGAPANGYGSATPLSFAAAQGNTSLLSELVWGYGADVDRSDNERTTPLMLAAELGQEQAVALLLQAKANPSLYDYQGRQALMFAAMSGNASCIKRLVQAGAAVDAVDSNNHTALIHALWADQPACMRALIEAGANIHTRDAQGRTPLMLAAEGHPECLRVLLEAGADLHARDNDEETAWEHAHFHQSHDCLQLLAEACRQQAVQQLASMGIGMADYEQALYEKAAEGRLDILKLLYTAGVDTRCAHPLSDESPIQYKEGALPAEPDALLALYRRTALAYAARAGQRGCLQFLLEQETSATAREIALAAALVHHQLPCVRLLLESGVEANARVAGISLLRYAAESNNREGTQLLLQAGADASAAEEQPCSLWAGIDCLPLLYQAGANPRQGWERAISCDDEARLLCMLEAGFAPDSECVRKAVACRALNCLKQLIKAGAPINGQDAHGRTPLMWAAAGWTWEGTPGNLTWEKELDSPSSAAIRCLDLLLAAGAQTDTRDEHGMTAAMMAAYKGHPRCLQKLINSGADVSLANNEGETALDLARRKNRFHCIRLLEATLPTPEETPADPPAPSPETTPAPQD